MGIISTINLKYKVKIKNEDNEVIGYKTILDDINIDVNKGEFIAILGHNGSGKSTFAKHLNALLLPNEGSVLINGEDTSTVDELWKIRRECGMVFQNPDNQIVGVTVEEDVSFGPENIGMPSADIIETVRNSLSKVDMLKLRKKSPNHLSGGQKQRVAIASSLAMKPECIVLDEPTAMLDPQGRKEVMKIIKELNHQESMTIILITHHMDEAVLADRIFVMDKGKPVLNGTPREVFTEFERIKELKLEFPQIMELAYRLYLENKMSRYDILSVEEFVEQYKNDYEKKYTLRSTIEKNNIEDKYTSENNCESDNACNLDNNYNPSNRFSSDNIYHRENYKINDTEESDESKKHNNTDEILKLENISCIYDAGTSMQNKALSNINLTIRENELIGIMGHTGSGKSTLIQLMNGLIKQSEGKVYFRNADISDKTFDKRSLHFSVGLVFQYPESQLFEETVVADVMYGPLNKGVDKEQAIRLAKQTLKDMDINEEYFEKSPFDLSGGEMRRVAIAGVVAMEPDVIILDEPTAGLDPVTRKKLLDSLKNLHDEKRKTIIIVSHNMEDIANYVDRLIVLNDSKIAFDDTTENVFKNLDELEAMGLAVPQVTYAMKRLKDLGYVSHDNILTVDEAVKILCC